MATYTLGAVKPHVSRAAYDIGPRFRIKTIYGWAQGQFDHPKGLALDFMTNTKGLGKSTGDALNSFVISNASAYNITYTIWYRQYYGKENGFKPTPYTGDSPHTDHVHVSFSSKPGDGNATLPGRFKDTSGFASTVTDPGTWLRLAGIITGGLFIAWGLWKVVKNGK